MRRTLLLVVLLAAGAVAAQPHPGRRSFWVGAGIGTMGPRSAVSMVAMGRGLGPGVIGGRMVSEVVLISLGPSASRADGAVLYGLVLGRHDYSLTVSTGVGIAQVSRVSEATGRLQGGLSVALPIDLHLVVASSRGVGLGVHAFADVNHRAPFVGLAVHFVLTD